MRRAMWGVWLAVALGCGGGTGGSSDPGAPDVPQGQDLPRVDVQMDPGGPDGTVPEDVAGSDTSSGPGRRIEFLVDVMFPQAVPASQAYTIRVRVVDNATNQGVRAAVVQFRIVKCEELAGEEILEYDGSLTTSAAITDENGRADGVFQAGESTELVYTVQVETDDANPATIQLVVRAMDCAKLLVKGGWAGSLSPAASLRVTVLPGDRTCDTLEVGNLPNPVAQEVGSDFQNGVEVPCVPLNQTFTVFVEAREVCPFAAGCLEGVASLGKDEVTEATVPLAGVSASLAGSFDVSHNWKFQEAFPACESPVQGCGGSQDFPRRACCFLESIERLFRSDGEAVVQGMIAAAAGSIAGHEGDFETAVRASVAAQVTSKLPPWAADYATVGPKALQAVRSVNVTSTMKLEAGATEGTYDGSETWKAYLLYWKTGCDPQDPQYYLCGKLTYGMDRFGGLAYSPAIPKSTMTVRRGEGNLLEVADHEVQMNPGRLLVFVASDIAARALTGGTIRDGIYKDGQATDVPSAFRLTVNCDDLAADLWPRVQGWYGGGQAGLKTLCTQGVTEALKPFHEALSAVTATSTLRWTGTATWSDQNCDLTGDRFSEGSETGTLNAPGGDPIALTGAFTANRQ